MSKNTVSNIADISYESSIDEFKKVLTGFSSDKQNLLNQNVSRLNLDASQGRINQNQLSSQDSKILNRLIGTISGGYYMMDMVSLRCFSSSPIAGVLKMIGDYFRSLGSANENDDSNNKNFYFYHEAAKGNFTNPYIKDSIRSESFNDLFRVNTNKNVKGEPDSNTNMSIGAVEFTSHTLSLAKRYGDALSLFFNCIPTVEMSLCAPFLDVKILVPESQSGQKEMSQDVFFRFEKFPDSKGFISKYINVGGVEDTDITTYDQHGMELFTSPQTLTNSNVRKVDPFILEPNAPLMTLKSCNITIAGMGVGLFCSKNARLELVLHDRSRLRDISPLISPEQFGRTRMIIEYGWSHPQGGPASNNTVGKFLNSMRDKGVFIVKGSSFNFSDGGHVNITVDLAMMGSKAPKQVSIAAGDYVQSSVFKREFEEVAKLIADLPKDSLVKEVRKNMRINIQNAKSAKGVMDREFFQQLKEKIAKGEKNDFIDAVITFMAEQDVMNNAASTAIMEKKASLPKHSLQTKYVLDHFLKTQNVSVLKSVIPVVDDNELFCSLGSVIMRFVAQPMMATYQFDEVQVFFYPFNQHSAGAYIHTTASFPIDLSALESILEDSENEPFSFNNMTISSFMQKLDSQIIRNPSYRHYGIGSDYAAISAIKRVTDEMIVDVSLGNATDEEVRDVAALKLSAEATAKITEEYSKRVDIKSDDKLSPEERAERLEELNSFGDLKDLKEEQIKKYKENLDVVLEQIYTFYGKELKKDNAQNYTTDAKFVLPNLSYYFETVTPYSTTGFSSFKQLGQEIKGMFTKSENTGQAKTILRIHVYDEEASASKSEELMLSLANSKQLVRAKDRAALNKVLKIKQTIKDKKAEKNIGEIVSSNLSFREIKSFIKQSMPSITIGSSLSNLQSFSAGSTTSNEIANVKLINALSGKDNISGGHQTVGALDQIEDMLVVPSVGTLNCNGMPLMQRGQQIFIDAGTGTTLDSIYTIQSVTHTIGESGFNTQAQVIYTGQSNVSSLRQKLADIVTDQKNSSVKVENEVKKLRAQKE